MKSRQLPMSVVGNLWRILVGAFVYAAGLVASRIVFHTIGISPPRMPTQADESIAGYYLLIGSIVLALGLAPIVRRIRGKYWIRWLIFSVFFFVCFAVSNSIEDSIYSSTEGIMRMVPILVLPSVVFTGVMALLFQPTMDEGTPPAALSDFFRGRTWGEWTWRILAAIIAFPVVYFVFGIVASPIVTEYYRQGVADLVLPDVGVILSVQLLRGFLYLLASLPVLIVWSGSRRQLIFLLGIAFFVLGATFEIILAFQLPSVLRVTHSIEILADSLVYAWLLATLLVQRKGEAI